MTVAQDRRTTWVHTAWARWKRPIRDGYLLVGALFAVVLLVIQAPRRGTFGLDAFSYWAASPPLYDLPVGTFGAYLYSPAFYQATEPLRGLDWPAFLWLWTALNVGTAIWFGPFILAFPFTWYEVYHGNIHLLLAAAIVLGFRHPWTWAFVLHTKATCGIGLLWFAVRREWRQLGIALGATAVVAVVSYLAWPAAWADYAAFLVRATLAGEPSVFAPPLWARLPVAAIIVVWGARTDRAWTVPLAALVALPTVWWHSPALLAGAILLWLRPQLARPRVRTPVIAPRTPRPDPS